jgi:hypothetical protein
VVSVPRRAKVSRPISLHWLPQWWIMNGDDAVIRRRDERSDGPKRWIKTLPIENLPAATP